VGHIQGYRIRFLFATSILRNRPAETANVHCSITYVTQQMMFGGSWTQHKLEVLSKYLRAYRLIFDRNPRARFFKTTYVDAFAGTGEIPRPALKGFFKDDPDLLKVEEEFRKGSVRRALEIKPPFDNYILIEKDAAKCKELEALAVNFPGVNIEVVNKDANEALLEWCAQMDTKKERAVVFLDPFGASVEWKVIKALARTKAVDLWILFPYAAINRMLVSDAMPPKAWAKRLTHYKGNGGEGGIRTLGTGVSPYNGLANRRIRPLCHLSAN
jgi:three-Cys-motif partner protein